MKKNATNGSWLIEHRKGLAVHGLILSAFVLYCVFLANPLFDRFEPGEIGASRLHEITLPSETNGIHYAIDRVGLGNTAVIIGWAFIGGQSSEDSQVYVVLSSTDDSYAYDTILFPRPDVSDGFHYLDLNLDDSGFIARIPMHGIKDGTYRVGVHIKKADIEALRYTRQLIVIKSEKAVEQVYLPSTVQRVSVPEPSGNLRFRIDYLGQLEIGGRDFIAMHGWAFIEGQIPAQSQTYVVLKSNGTGYVFDTWTNYAPWVRAQFGITDLGLDWAGFIARIPKESIEDGTYKVGIYIKKGDVEALQYTDKVLTKTGEGIDFDDLSFLHHDAFP